MDKKYKIITTVDRQLIARWCKSGVRPTEMAERLGVHTATIYRELQRGGVSRRDNPILSAYSPEAADAIANENMKRRGWHYAITP